MRHLSYLAVLAFCLVGTLPLELWLGVRVYRQWRRLLLTLLPVVAVFVVVPVCSLLSFEAVRKVRGWPAGDE